MSPRCRRLQAAIHSVRVTKLSIHAAATAHSVPYSTLRDNLQIPEGAERKKRGRPLCLSAAEELLIEQAILDFADRAFPLRTEDILDMIQMFVARLPAARRRRLPFKQNRPGHDFMVGFMRRHPALTFRRRASLEQQRKLSMCPRTMAMHFARLVRAYIFFNIVSPRQVFNIDESGVSSRTGGRGKGKAVMRSKGRSNSVELEFAGNAEHLTVMPVISADGKPWNPVVILPGTLHKFRTRPDGTTETLVDYLPPGSYVTHRTPASMDTDIFAQWVELFITETEQLRRTFKYILVTMDGFGAHISYRALARLAEKNIIAYALPSHTSHRTQVLDYSVFSPMKEYLRRQWSMRLIGTQAERSNDCFTLCEMVHKAYMQSVTYTNIVNGFSACGLWSKFGGGVDPSVITASDLTNRDVDETGEQCYTRYQDLLKDFAASRDILKSDGPNLVNGHINSKTGVLCHREDLLAELKAREDERAAERLAREQREKEREQRRSERAEAARVAEERRKIQQTEREARAREKAAEAVRKAAEKAEAERLKEVNRIWDANIHTRWQSLEDSRATRRAAARLRSTVRASDN